MDDVFEDGKDHGFGCDSDDNAFEAGLLDAAADANRSKLKCKVDDGDNDIVADLEKNFVTMDLNPLYCGDLKTHNPLMTGQLLHQIQSPMNPSLKMQTTLEIGPVFLSGLYLRVLRKDKSSTNTIPYQLVVFLFQ